MKPVTLLYFSCLVILNINAYTPNISNFYTLYKQYYNPAMAGISGKSDITLIGQYQYSGFEDKTPAFYMPYKALFERKPTTQISISGNTNIKLKNKHSLGLGFTNQINRNTFLLFNHLRINTNWQYAIKETKRISLGLGFSNYTHVFNQKEYFNTYNVPYFDSINNKTTHNLNVDAGATYINTKNNFYIGIAVLDLYHHKPLTFGNPELIIEQNPDLNFTILSGIDIKLSEKWIAQPHFILNKQTSNFELILGAKAIFKNKYNFGINYISNDALFLSGGYQINALSINYGYNLPLSRLLSVSSGTHNLGFNYAF